MLAVLASKLLGILGFVACGFALWRGGRPERLAAIAVLLNIGLGLIGTYAPADLREIVLLCSDGLTAVIFMGLTILFAHRWLGAVMLLYAAQFAVHAYYLVAGRPADKLFYMAGNLVFAGVIVLLFVGGGLAARRRRTDALPT